MPKGLVISDLHLFSPRSLGDEILPQLRAKLSATQLLVINGDLVDFRWSVLGDVPSTAQSALMWLGHLLEDFKNLRLHYVIGNADYRKWYLEGLKEFAKSQPRLAVHEEYLILDRKLFLHGDIVHARGDLNSYRGRCEAAGHGSRLFDKLYDFAVASGLSRWHAARQSQSHSAQAIVKYLSQKNDPRLAGIREIYFGHTHAPFENFRHDNLLFHNTGALMRGLSGNMVLFEI